MTTIAITGATGHIGGAVARALAEGAGADSRPAAVRQIVRDASRAPDLVGSTVAVAEYADARAARTALTGVDVLFLVSAHESADRVHEHRTMVEAARDAGVRHIVYTSFVGAGESAGFTLARDHGATEQAIRAAGVSFTFLRDNFYLDLLPFFADVSGVIRGPAGDGRSAAVARADVADAAVAVLRNPAAHDGAIYDLTGREALTLAELAVRASAATGRAVTFHDETVEEAYASRRAGYPDAPQWQLDAWVSTYTAICDGQLADVSSDLAGERQELGQALRQLTIALDRVATFVNHNAGRLHQDVHGLTGVARLLVKNRGSLDETLAIAPVALSNIVHAYREDLGAIGTRSNLNDLIGGTP